MSAASGRKHREHMTAEQRRAYDRWRNLQPAARARRAAYAKSPAGRAVRNRMATNARARRHALIDEIKARLGCARCGESDPACLLFHHRDPATKQGHVSKLKEQVSLENLMAEIAKCDVLCANCHMKEHHRQWHGV